MITHKEMHTKKVLKKPTKTEKHQSVYLMHANVMPIPCMAWTAAPDPSTFRRKERRGKPPGSDKSAPVISVTS